MIELDPNEIDDNINILREEVVNANRVINIADNEVANIHNLIDNSITELNNDIRLNLNCQVLYGTNYSDFTNDLNLPTCKYYSEDDIKNFLNATNAKYLSTFSINVQSILSKYNDVTLFIDNINSGSSKLNILAMQEIWHSFDLTFNGYQYIKNSRRSGSGGGVGFLVSKGIAVTSINDDKFFRDRIYECLTLSITVCNLKIHSVKCLPSANRPWHD